MPKRFLVRQIIENVGQQGTYLVTLTMDVPEASNIELVVPESEVRDYRIDQSFVLIEEAALALAGL